MNQSIAVKEDDVILLLGRSRSERSRQSGSRSSSAQRVRGASPARDTAIRKGA